MFNNGNRTIAKIIIDNIIIGYIWLLMHTVITIGPRRLPSWAIDYMIPALIACTFMGKDSVKNIISSV